MRTVEPSRFAFVMLLLISIIAISIWATMPMDGINRESFERIREGMSAEEVRDLLGAKPGTYSVGTVWTSSDDPMFLEKWFNPSSVHWIGERGAIAVVCDENGLVASKAFGDVHRESYSARIRRWLGLAQ